LFGRRYNIIIIVVITVLLYCDMCVCVCAYNNDYNFSVLWSTYYLYIMTNDYNIIITVSEKDENYEIQN